MNIEPHRRRRVTIVQGEAYATSEPDIELSTILGSCISICLYDAVCRAGGMNHFLLTGSGNPDRRDMRYGLHAFEQLLNALIKLGATRETLVAKVFGGCAPTTRSPEIGESNANFAVKLLRDEKIRLDGSEMGGTLARKVRFVPSTGDAYVMNVPRVLANDSPSRANTDASAGDAEFF